MLCAANKVACFAAGHTQAAHETAQAVLRRDMDSKQSRLKARLEQRVEERRASRTPGPNSPQKELPELAELPRPDQQGEQEPEQEQQSQEQQEQEQQEQEQEQQQEQQQQRQQITGDPPELAVGAARPTAHDEHEPGPAL